MKKVCSFLLIVLVLTACSQQANEDMIEEDEEEMLSMAEVKIPEVIFTSEKQREVIDEDELKSTIQLYLDSSEELFIAIEPFLDALDEEEELDAEELGKMNTIYTLMKENDENYFNYILTNTLPEEYQEESVRISRFITAANQLLYEIEGIENATSEGNIPNVDFKSMLGNIGAASGKEQKKIEDFLDQHDIKTKAFGREN